MTPGKRLATTLMLGACFALVLGGCDRDKPIETGSAVPGGVGNVVSLDQGMSLYEQQGFWFDTQGTEFVPYNWFLHLEQAGNDQLFRANDNVKRLGYIPLGPTKWNPDGLPLGWAKGKNPITKRDWMGFNCAACHTGHIEYQGTGIIVEGGPTMGDFGMYITELIDALSATGQDDAKFERFANNVLGEGHSEGEASDLRTELVDYTTTLTARNALNIPPHPAGHARLDAAGTIFNQVMSWDLGVAPTNSWVTNAPVAYPAIWDAPHTDLVQWNGSVSNEGAGPVIRNIAEVLGVYLTFHFEKENVGTPENPIYGEGYESSAQLASQGNLEKWLKAMTSPKWPETILPAIDAEKAGRGRAHYERLCIDCHAILEDTRDPNRELTAVQIKVDSIGTDTLYYHNFNWRLLERPTISGRLAGTPINLLTTEPVMADTLTGGEALITNAAVGILARDPKGGIINFLRSRESFTDPGKWDEEAYRTRPLNGMWSSAPFLHNGSVLNLWELFQPDSLRLKTFKVGSLEFDPVNVGYVNDGNYTLDVTLIGDSNSGHSGAQYGADLSDDEKWELIEFLKTL